MSRREGRSDIGTAIVVLAVAAALFLLLRQCEGFSIRLPNQYKVYEAPPIEKKLPF